MVPSFRGDQILSFATNHRSLAQLESGKKFLTVKKNVNFFQKNRFFGSNFLTVNVRDLGFVLKDSLSKMKPSFIYL